MRIAIGALGLSLVALVACGEPQVPDPGTGAAASPDEALYEVTSAVVVDDGERVMLCVGPIPAMSPPRCGRMPITNWSWDDVSDEESASGTTWGTYNIIGTYDGEAFTVAEPPEAPRPHDIDTDLTAPCGEPDGGWSAPDPSMASNDDRTKTMRAARGEPDYAESWIDYIDDPETEEEFLEGEYILVMAFTGDLDRHEAVARETWGGPLCLVQHERTYKELRKIQRELGTERLAEELGYEMLSSGVYVSENIVGLTVVVATPEMLAGIEERYGPGTVEVDAALRPLE